MRKLCGHYAEIMLIMHNLCENYAKIMRKLCKGYAEIMRELCVLCKNYAELMRKLCQNYAEIMHQLCGNYAEIMHKLCVLCILCNSQIYMQIMRKLCGNYAEIMRKLCGYVAILLSTRLCENYAKLCENYANYANVKKLCGLCRSHFADGGGLPQSRSRPGGRAGPPAGPAPAGPSGRTQPVVNASTVTDAPARAGGPGPGRHARRCSATVTRQGRPPGRPAPRRGGGRQGDCSAPCTRCF